MYDISPNQHGAIPAVKAPENEIWERVYQTVSSSEVDKVFLKAKRNVGVMQKGPHLTLKSRTDVRWHKSFF